LTIYFAGSISGGRKFVDIYEKIVQYLQSCGHTVSTEHIIQPDVIEHEGRHTDEEIYTRDIKWLTSADCLIAEVSNPSLGVGYEICYALNHNVPVLCLYQDGIFLTRMLTGNTNPGLSVNSYNGEEWKEIIDVFLKKL